jgi:hypothetical protein
MPYSRIFSALCMVLLCAAASISAASQETKRFQAATLSTEWKTSDEVTLAGTIQQVFTKKPSGAPGGVNLLMSGSQNGMIVNLGSGLDQQTQKSLASGTSIEVIGLVHRAQGEEYLLARQITLAGRTLQVRSANGFPIHTSSQTASPHARHIQSTLNGGAR